MERDGERKGCLRRGGHCKHSVRILSRSMWFIKCNWNWDWTDFISEVGPVLALKPQKRLQLLRKRDRYMFFAHIFVLFFCLSKEKIATCPRLREEWLACATLCPTATKPGSRQGTRSLILSRWSWRGHIIMLMLQRNFNSTQKVFLIGRSLCEVWRDAIVASLLTGCFCFVNCSESDVFSSLFRS